MNSTILSSVCCCISVDCAISPGITSSSEGLAVYAVRITSAPLDIRPSGCHYLKRSTYLQRLIVTPGKAYQSRVKRFRTRACPLPAPDFAWLWQLKPALTPDHGAAPLIRTNFGYGRSSRPCALLSRSASTFRCRSLCFLGSASFVQQLHLTSSAR